MAITCGGDGDLRAPSRWVRERPWNLFVWLHGLLFITEHIFSNILPPFLGVFICRSHIATAWLWFTMALLSTLNAHSGYHFPFFPSPQAHDFHHLKWVDMGFILHSVQGTVSMCKHLKVQAWHQDLLQQDDDLTKLFWKMIFPSDSTATTGCWVFSIDYMGLTPCSGTHRKVNGIWCYSPLYPHTNNFLMKWKSHRRWDSRDNAVR